MLPIDWSAYKKVYFCDYRKNEHCPKDNCWSRGGCCYHVPYKEFEAKGVTKLFLKARYGIKKLKGEVH